jgi:hypothetical protein
MGPAGLSGGRVALGHQINSAEVAPRIGCSIHRDEQQRQLII